MRMLALLLMMLAVCTAGIAQENNIYLKGGLNLANVSTTSNGRVEDANSLLSFHVGLLADLPISRFLSVQPGLFFTGKGTKSQSGQTTDATYFKATSHPYYIELPVYLSFKIPLAEKGSNFLAGVGPYVAMGVAGKNKAEGKIFSVAFSSEKSINFSNDDASGGDYAQAAGFGTIRRFDYGLNGMVGLELDDVLLTVNYGYGLAKLQPGSNNTQDDKNKHRVLGLSLGFRL